MEDLNIKGMFKNKKWSHKLQQISLYTLLQMIKYKKIQSRMVRQKIHPNRQILPLQQKMPPLRKNKPRIKNPHEKMEMLKL